MNRAFKIISILSLIGIASGCASWKKLEGPVPTSYVAETGPVGENPKELQDVLVRRQRNSDFSVEAIPLSGAYMETAAQDTIFKEALQGEAAQKLINDAKTTAMERVCFSVMVSSTSKPEAAVLKYWGAELIGADQKTIPLEFLDKHKPPQTTRTQEMRSYAVGGSLWWPTRGFYASTFPDYYTYFVTTTWASSLACAPRSSGASLTLPFTLRLQPRYERGREAIEFKWTAKK